MLEKRYESVEETKKENGAAAAAAAKAHCIEEATAHFIVKQILTKDNERENKSLLSKKNTSLHSQIKISFNFSIFELN